jgi:hypothetical protein
MIETELIEVLVNDADVSALVGDRVALTVIPEDSAAPYIVCQLITGQRPGSLSSTGNRRRLRIQVNCYAKNVLQAKAVVEAAQNAIENYENFEVVFNGDQDLYDATTKLCYTVLDYSITQNPD